MRNYQILDSSTIDQDNVLLLSPAEDNPEKPTLSMSHEGAFISLSASFGPLEIALRIRQNDLRRRLEQLYPVPGLATTHQIGSVNSYIAIGLTKDSRLVMRPTVVADASGRVTFNLVTIPALYETIVKWVGTETEA